MQQDPKIPQTKEIERPKPSWEALLVSECVAFDVVFATQRGPINIHLKSFGIWNSVRTPTGQNGENKPPALMVGQRKTWGHFAMAT